MSEMETGDASAQPQARGDRPNDSWGPNLPALRMTHSGPNHGEPAPQAPVTTYSIKAPWYLRPLRLLTGLALLVIAWGLTALDLYFGQYLYSMIPSVFPLTLGLLTFALEAIALLWLAVVTLAVVLAGAFALAIGLGARGW